MAEYPTDESGEPSGRPIDSTTGPDLIKGQSGKGQRDDVTGSPIWPASGPRAPDDAELRSPAELGHPEERTSPHPGEPAPVITDAGQPEGGPLVDVSAGPAGGEPESP